MKKGLCFLILFLCFNIESIKAESISVNKCIDGDTVSLKIDGKVKKVRFLAVDTPETKHPTKGEEPFGKEASSYTCNALMEASEIKLEYEKDKTDKYDRVLAWVFADDNLLQDELVKNGLARVAYLYDDYKYTDLLKKSQLKAKMDKVGIWGNYKVDFSEYYKYIGIVVIVIILCIYDKSYRKKTIKSVKRKAKNSVDKLFK